MAKNEHINLIEYLDIAELPEGDQAGYIRQFTTIILDGAIEELASGLNKSEAKILENYLSIQPTFKQLMEHLQKEYPKFQTILKDLLEIHHTLT